MKLICIVQNMALPGGISVVITAESYCEDFVFDFNIGSSVSQKRQNYRTWLYSKMSGGSCFAK